MWKRGEIAFSVKDSTKTEERLVPKSLDKQFTEEQPNIKLFLCAQILTSAQVLLHRSCCTGLVAFNMFGANLTTNIRSGGKEQRDLTYSLMLVMCTLYSWGRRRASFRHNFAQVSHSMLTIFNAG